MIALESQNHAPPKWSEFEKYIDLAGFTPLFSNARTVNRFRARYRLAKSFQKLDLNGYSRATALGYDGFTKVTLWWSAFEQLCQSLKIPLNNLQTLAIKYPLNSNLMAIRAHDTDGVFFKFVKYNLSSKEQKRKIEQFLNGEYCSSLTLAKAIRHIFLHGALTPNVNGSSPEKIYAICDILGNALNEIIDKEFEEQVIKLINMFPDRG